MKEKKDQFEIRCYLNKKRRFTHTLTKFEALTFRNTARYLSRFLTQAYGLGK